MITNEQIEKYSEIYKTEGNKAADAFAAPIIAGLNLATPADRGKIWDEFRSQVIVEQQQTKINEKRATNNNASIKKVCEKIISRYNPLPWVDTNFTERELTFLKDIKSKRKLSEKQEHWLRALAEKAGIKIEGEFARKAKRVESGKFESCKHEDLGSFGYTHGSTVRCPHCGQMTEVW